MNNHTDPDLVERAPAPRARRARALELQCAHVARCDTAVLLLGVGARAGNEHGLVAARAASVHFFLFVDDRGPVGRKGTVLSPQWCFEPRPRGV